MKDLKEARSGEPEVFWGQREGGEQPKNLGSPFSPLLEWPAVTKETEGEIKKNEKSEKSDKPALTPSVLQCDAGQGAQAKTRLLHSFPGCSHWLSFMHLAGVPVYLSMSHTGPATRLTLPLLLYNSTVPSSAPLPPLASFLEFQSRTVG